MDRCIDTIVDHYLIAAIFTAGDGELDEFSVADFTAEARDESKKEIEDFLSKAAERGIDTSMWSDELLGHDFSLTRNGHGAGFWDRFPETPEPGDALTELCKEFGEVYVSESDGVLSFD